MLMWEFYLQDKAYYGGIVALYMFTFLSLFFFGRFLLDHSASVSAVNNDGELAIDISESDEMEELLQKE